MSANVAQSLHITSRPGAVRMPLPDKAIVSFIQILEEVVTVVVGVVLIRLPLLLISVIIG